MIIIDVEQFSRDEGPTVGDSSVQRRRPNSFLSAIVNFKYVPAWVHAVGSFQASECNGELQNSAKAVFKSQFRALTPQPSEAHGQDGDGREARQGQIWAPTLPGRARSFGWPRDTVALDGPSCCPD